MSITINRVTCNKWGQELAATHETLHSVCESLNNAVQQTRREFGAGRVYNGGYIRPAPVKQGAFYLYPLEAGSFTLTTHPLEQHSLAVMEEVLTKEMLTSYLYEVCAAVAAATIHVYVDNANSGVSHAVKCAYRGVYQRDAAEYFNTLHIAALREDMQRAASRVPFCEQEMGRARHNESKIFEKWGYSEGLLKRARHEINKRGAKVNKLRKEVKELEGAVQHLAKENVELTVRLSDALRRNIERSIMGQGGLNGRSAPLYPSMSEQHERERVQGQPNFTVAFQLYKERFAESRKSFEKVMKIHALKERYKGMMGKPEHVKLEYFTVKHASERFRFIRHAHREWCVLDDLNLT